MTREQGLASEITHLLCPNPGPMTLTGTNTYLVLRFAGRGHANEASNAPDAVVIDPGPPWTEKVRSHYETVHREVDAHVGLGEVAIVLTHHHDDHRGGADHLAEQLRLSGHAVTIYGADREELPHHIGGLRVIRTPGHTADSVCFLYANAGASVLFTGDTVLGGSSSFVAHPDGNLTEYLDSLAVLEQLLGQSPAILAPGHGVVGADAASAVRGYRLHRQERLDQVAAAVASIGPEADVDAVIDAVYPDVGQQLRPAVQAIVRAQLEHLRR